MRARNLILIITSIFLCSCVAGDFLISDAGDMKDFSDGPSEGEGGADSEGNGNSLAGVVTAGEWNDLDHWGFWNDLMYGQNAGELISHLHYWSMYPHCRFAVTVTDENQKPVCGAKVELFRDGSDTPVWAAVSDNRGSAELWDLTHSDTIIEEERNYTISINGKTCQEVPQATFSHTEICMNNLTAKKTEVRKRADIAFIVDATGSMYDEIDFLKDDLLDIIQKAEAASNGIKLRTAALFYRDEGDDYVTRYDNFTTKPESTLKFIKKQEADGGGDYPEAVHTALETALQSLSWEEDNYTRIAFLLLDAPPHHEEEIIGSIHKSIKMYAGKGIKIIPIAASGVDKNTEFLLRLMAIFTDGTYTFITDHSGVGNNHLTPTVGEYKVELLNELIIRLIGEYTE